MCVCVCVSGCCSCFHPPSTHPPPTPTSIPSPPPASVNLLVVRWQQVMPGGARHRVLLPSHSSPAAAPPHQLDMSPRDIENPAGAGTSSVPCSSSTLLAAKASSLPLPVPVNLAVPPRVRRSTSPFNLVRRNRTSASRAVVNHDQIPEEFMLSSSPLSILPIDAHHHHHRPRPTTPYSSFDGHYAHRPVHQQQLDARHQPIHNHQHHKPFSAKSKFSQLKRRSKESASSLKGTFY